MKLITYFKTNILFRIFYSVKRKRTNLKIPFLSRNFIQISFDYISAQILILLIQVFFGSY